MVLFANTLTNKVHQRDEFNFISNAAWAAVLNGQAAEEPATGYSDVAAGAWYADAVAAVTEQGLMNGVTSTAFGPGVTTTRSMLVTTLYRMAGQPDLSDENLGYPFADVVADSWYGDAVYWARLNSVANGTSDSTFSPTAPSPGSRPSPCSTTTPTPRAMTPPRAAWPRRSIPILPACPAGL